MDNPFQRRATEFLRDDEAFLAILDVLARDDEYGCVELWHLDLIVPLESANLLFPQSRVHLK